MTAAEKTSFLVWLSDQRHREDAVGIYGRAVFDDYEAGSNDLPRLAVGTAFDDAEWAGYVAFCAVRGIDPSFSNLLMLGKVMGAMEFAVAFVTGPDPVTATEMKTLAERKKTFSRCLDILPGLLQDIDSDMRSDVYAGLNK